MVTAPTILTLAAGLAMDATAVSAARGFATDALRVRDVVRVAVFFGGFQALMPLVGWFLGDTLIGPFVRDWGHWIAFALLGLIGGKMLWDAFAGSEREDDDAPRGDLFGTRVMLVLAVATSVDALAVGITLPMLGAPMLWSLLSIGLVTAALSALGLWAGRRFGDVFGNRLEIVGGLVLIALGSKILVEHLGLL